MANEVTETTTINNIDKTDNPLRKYRTYSYQFILVAADNTQIFDNPLTKASNSTTFFNRPAGSNPRAAIVNDQGQYSIVIDSRVDTDFIIQDVEWGTTFIGNSNSSDSPVALNTFLTDGRMIILEPRGVNFLNVLSSLAGTLNADPSIMPFMLKVLFVGHNEDGTIDQITDIPPFGIFITDITGSIDENGTTYHVTYSGAVNGTAWDKPYNSIVDNISFVFHSSSKPDAVGTSARDHLASFANQINYYYNQSRDRIIKNYAAAGFDLSKTAKIQWNFVLENNSEIIEKLTDFGTVNPTVSGDGAYAAGYRGSKEGGVEELISRWMTSSKTWAKIQTDGNPVVSDFDKNVPVRYSFKIATEIVKTSPLKGDNTINITYYISEYKYKAVPVTPEEANSANANEITIPTNQTYVFDYLFTGKNIDIIKLDMNMSMGYALWLQLITTRAIPTQTEDVTGKATQAATIPTRPPSGNMNPDNTVRTGTPIWPPAFSKDTYMKEYTSTAQVAAADSIWRNFASYQAIQADLTIHGNPNLIQKITNPVRSGPDYVKINVKKPNTTDDIWEYQQTNDLYPGGYYDSFWFDGFYNIITAKNKFNGGQFTQELYLIAIPEVSSDMTKLNQAQDEENIESQVPAFTFEPIAPPIISTPFLDLTTGFTNPLSLSKQTNTSVAPLNHSDFVARYWNNALLASQRFSSTNGTPQIQTDFIMAQAALESNWGASSGATKYFNFFGFKGFPKNPRNIYWDGTTAAQATHEQTFAGLTPTSANFRVYQSADDGFGDYVRLISQRYGDTDASTTISQYASGLQNKPGGGSYATDPLYASKLIARYNEIQLIKAGLSPPIVGNNPYGGSSFSESIQQPAPSPFLANSTVPTSSQKSATPTTYSATDRSISDAAAAQKTLLSVPIAGVAASL